MVSCIHYENPLDFVKYIKNAYRVRGAFILIALFTELIIIYFLQSSIYVVLFITFFIFIGLMVVNWFADLPVIKGVIFLKQKTGEDIILEMIYETEPESFDIGIYGNGSTEIHPNKIFLHKIIFPGHLTELSIRGGPHHYFLRIVGRGNLIAVKQCDLHGETLSMTINIGWIVKDIPELFYELKEEETFLKELKSSTLTDTEVIPWKFFEQFVSEYLHQQVVPLLKNDINRLLENIKPNTPHEQIKYEIGSYLSKFIVYDNWLSTDGIIIENFNIDKVVDSSALADPSEIIVDIGTGSYVDTKCVDISSTGSNHGIHGKKDIELDTHSINVSVSHIPIICRPESPRNDDVIVIIQRSPRRNGASRPNSRKNSTNTEEININGTSSSENISTSSNEPKLSPRIAEYLRRNRAASIYH